MLKHFTCKAYLYIYIYIVRSFLHEALVFSYWLKLVYLGVCLKGASRENPSSSWDPHILLYYSQKAAHKIPQFQRKQKRFKRQLLVRSPKKALNKRRKGSPSTFLGIPHLPFLAARSFPNRKSQGFPERMDYAIDS